MARKPKSVGMLAYKALYGSVSVEELARLKGSQCPTEKAEHMMFMEWVRVNPMVNAHLIHIPNGERREAHVGSQLKAMGVKAGVSDFFLALPNGEYAGLWLELKRIKGYTLQKNQEEWLELMRGAGYQAVFAYGAEDAIKKVEEYMRQYHLSAIGGSRLGDNVGVNR
jgi:hypothetical protein